MMLTHTFYCIGLIFTHINLLFFLQDKWGLKWLQGL